jgi:hypothetical protein
MRERLAVWVQRLWRQKVWLIVLFLYKLGEDRILGAINGFVDAVFGGRMAQEVDAFLAIIPALTWLLIPIAIVGILVQAYVDTRPPRPEAPAAHTTTEAPVELALPRIGLARPAPVAASPLERVFVPTSVTPQFLNAFFEGGRTDAQGQQSVAPYIGKWMPYRGDVGQVQVFENRAVITSYIDIQQILRMSMGLWFEASLRERVGLQNINDPIAVVGRIASISHYEIALHDCEFVE